MKKEETEELEEIFYQVTVKLKGGMLVHTLDELLDKKGWRQEWEKNVVEPLKAAGFEDSGDGRFINFSGDIRDEKTAAKLAGEALGNDWVAENAKGVELAEIGPLMHFDIATGTFMRDERHPKLPE